MAPDDPTAGARGRSAALALVLVLSGAAALLHESAWFRLLVPTLGAGSLPVATVAAGALLGLGLGSALAGRWAQRSGRPGLLLAAAEVVAAGAAFAVPAVLERVGSVRGGVGLALATGLLALAAVPWGVSLPAAVALADPPSDRAGRVFARLYAWNTLGAVLGVALGAAVLFEALGNRGTLHVACLLELAAAGGAAGLGRRRLAAPPRGAVGSLQPPRSPGVPNDPAQLRAPVRGTAGGHEDPFEGPSRAAAAGAPAGGARALLPLLGAAALAGAAGVGLQVAWGRRLTPILGATFPVFACVLAIHLLAIAAGSALLGPRRARRPAGALTALTLAAALATVGTPFLLGRVVEAVRARWWDAYGDVGAMLGLRAAAAAVLVLPPALLGAALLPWLVRAAAVSGERGARASGRVLAANTVGGAGGGLFVALVAIPGLGTAGALLLCAAALLLAGGCASSGRARRGLGAAGAVLALVPFVAPIPDPDAATVVGALYSPSEYRPDDVETVLARDGRTASVLVREREERLEYWVEGSYESSTGPTDRLHLALLGHLPLVLFGARVDRPARVALVGLGGGFTAQAVARHRPTTLSVYELEPIVADAAERFRPFGGGLPPGASLHLEDGRRGILEGEGPLDVISSDPVHPSVAGSAYLYAVEWWRAAMGRLSPEGVLVQWLPLYQLHVEELRLVLRTFVASVPYPYVALVGGDALLVASRSPLRVSAGRLARGLAREACDPLRAFGLGTPGRLLGLFVLDPDGCRAVAGSGDLNTDDRLLLELRAGWREGNDPASAYALLTSRLVDPRTLLDGPAEAGFEEGLSRAQALRDAMRAWVGWDAVGAWRRFRSLADADPGDGLAARMRDEAAVEVARALLRAGRAEEAAAFARALAAQGAGDATLRLDAAEVLLGAGAVGEAKAIAAPYAAARTWPRARRLAAGRVR